MNSIYFAPYIYVKLNMYNDEKMVFNYREILVFPHERNVLQRLYLLAK